MKDYLLLIKEAHVLRSALSLLANPAPEVEKEHTWAVTIEGHTFATKSLIRRAYCYAAGISFDNIPDEFYSAKSFTTQQARAVLEKIGFNPHIL